jgi:hypothetical protein
MEIPPTIPPPIIAVRPQPIPAAPPSNLLLPSYYSDRRLTLSVDQSQKVQFDVWVRHYQVELHDMYHSCVDPALNISWDQFVQGMYKSTLEIFDHKQFKWVRPLL